MTQRVLVVFVDALGPAQLARLAERPGSLPHRAHLDGVLGYSSGALPTVLTGVTPARHGRMCLFTQRAPDAEPVLRPLAWLGLLPRILHERPRVRGLFGRWLAEARGLDGYVNLGRVPPAAFRWLDLPEREDLFAARDIGGSPTFLESARWTDILARLEARPPDLAFLYATELDGLLHAQGNRGRDVDAALDRLAARIWAQGRSWRAAARKSAPSSSVIRDGRRRVRHRSAFGPEASRHALVRRQHDAAPVGRRAPARARAAGVGALGARWRIPRRRGAPVPRRARRCRARRRALAAPRGDAEGVRPICEARAPRVALGDALMLDARPSLTRVLTSASSHVLSWLIAPLLWLVYGRDARRARHAMAELASGRGTLFGVGEPELPLRGSDGLRMAAGRAPRGLIDLDPVLVPPEAGAMSRLRARAWYAQAKSFRIDVTLALRLLARAASRTHS